MSIFFKSALRIIFFTSLLGPCSLLARSILDELQIIRALTLAQPDSVDHAHRFSACTFTRHISTRTGNNSEKPFFNGSAFLYKYVHSYGYIGLLTAIGNETNTFNNRGKRFKRSRFGIDDIGISLNLTIIDHDEGELNISGLIGIATSGAEPLGTLVGAGHNQVGLNAQFRFDVFKEYELRFFGELQILKSFKRTVFLDKTMEVIHHPCCTKPFFRETFDVGTVFSNLFALRRGTHDNGFEAGYHGVIIFDVHDALRPLSYEGFTKASMKSCLDNHKGMERLTLHKNGNRPTYVHHLFAQYNFVYETALWPIGIVFGGAYAFGSDAWQAFLAWMAVSVRF